MSEERIVIADLWYWDDTLPNTLQSWTWQTVDVGPHYPRIVEWLNNMGQVVRIHHFQIREYDRPVPYYPPGLVASIPNAIQ